MSDADQLPAPESLARLPIDEFLSRLACDAPAPGGGSVAALVGALAAGLGEMACAFTVGRPKFASVEAGVQAAAARLKHARALLTALLDDDAAAYCRLSVALKLPKVDPTRPERVANAARDAAAVPLAIMALSRKVRSDLARLQALANPNLRSDVQCGVHLASAAMHAAAANVRANLPFLEAKESERVAGELERLVAGQ